MTVRQAFQSAEVLHLAPAGRVIHEPALFDQQTAARMMALVHAELPWAQLPIRLFGKQVMQPRLTAFCGDSGVRYRYSGLLLEADGWPSCLAAVRARLGELPVAPFNSVLCNLYRDGQDSMGWHADNERELGQDPVIASVSFGATRRFLLRPRRGGRSVEFELGNGSLLLMSGDVQHHWLHQVPKTRRSTGQRINLTFRTIKSDPAR